MARLHDNGNLVRGILGKIVDDFFATEGLGDVD